MSSSEIVSGYDATLDVTQAYAVSASKYRMHDVATGRAKNFISYEDYLDNMTTRLQEEGYDVSRSQVEQLGVTSGLKATKRDKRSTFTAELFRVYNLDTWVSDRRVEVAQEQLESSQNLAKEIQENAKKFGELARANAQDAVGQLQTKAEEAAQKAIDQSMQSAEDFLGESRITQSLARAKAAASGTTLTGTTSLYLQSLHDAAEATADEMLKQGQKAADKQRQIGSSAVSNILAAGAAASQSSLETSKMAVEKVLSSIDTEMQSVMETAESEHDILRTESAIASMTEASWGKTSGVSENEGSSKWKKYYAELTGGA